ncbi:unnamed protein product [Prunus armeniaca]
MHLWGEAIKTANYILNRMPNKSVPKLPFQIWTTRKPNLRHLHVWSCNAEARIYNPQEKKLDPKMISCYFIGYPARSKEEGNVAVIENDEQEVTTLIPLSETVLEPPQFEEPVDK